MHDMITILGPTASGKTRLAVALALKLNAEIISADSRQAYRRMDIGTGKDLGDYCVEGQCVPFHLIDICEPGTKYNLFEYQRDFLAAYDSIRGRNRLPLLCGGTGLYIESVLKGYQLSPVPQDAALRERLSDKSLDELTEMLRDLKRQTGSAMHNRSDVDTPQRAIRAIEIEMGVLAARRDKDEGRCMERSFPQINSVILGVDIDREERRKKITARLKERLEQGMADEVRSLLDEGISPEDLTYYGLEYRYVTEYVTGKITFDEMFQRLEIAIHQFAKRQMTWFRGMERRGFTIHWIDAMLPMDEKISQALSYI